MKKQALKLNSCLKAYFFTGNFGDQANVDLYVFLSGKRPAHDNDVRSFLGQHGGHPSQWWLESREEMMRLLKGPCYVSMGSILTQSDSLNKAEVWGAGTFNPTLPVRFSLKETHAVRGPLTRDYLRKQGHDFPEVYGDPGVLFPLIFSPTKKKRYKLGVVPHYVDKHHPAVVGAPDDVLIIDVFKPPTEIIENICSCEVIASSSLHGLIAADAFGVPTTWVVFGGPAEWGNNALSRGGAFKYMDYFASISKNERPLVDAMLETTMPVDKLIMSSCLYEQGPLRAGLISACPFVSDDRKTELLTLVG